MSPLWVARRCYAERSGKPWMILSAQYGLVNPEEEIETYDLALARLSAAERADWGRRVVSALEERFGVLDGWLFEVHAGADRSVAPARNDPQVILGQLPNLFEQPIHRSDPVVLGPNRIYRLHQRAPMLADERLTVHQD